MKIILEGLAVNLSRGLLNFFKDDLMFPEVNLVGEFVLLGSAGKPTFTSTTKGIR